ncbi:Neuronal membrane glycoprotein M6-b [Trichinella papuae]|uniref:Neuronal membrane glycoprotein M6-b n=1 Tax=Trichinella papuae TaxID=268474 RepID=A0A0V1MV03_9BILA|nr:Neuronal membrane glycoprotein M6-b [Trichinella papuae]
MHHGNYFSRKFIQLLLFATKEMDSRKKGTYRSTNLERAPYASLIALSICVFGLTFLYSSYEAFLMQQQFHWFDKVKFVFIGLAIVMLSFLLLLTIFGLLATGSTRDRLYSSWRSRISGRVTIVLLFLLNYFIYICWLEIFTIVIGLFFMNIFFKNLCKTVPGYESENCLDFRAVGILFNSTESLQIWNTCGVTLQQFCLFTDSANGYYVISYFSTAVVLLGLVHFLICLTANYVHLSGGFKYFQLRTMPLFEGEQVVDYQNERLG